ncbi:MAG: hypothetical protein IT334_07835, partial [Thermomicrobiales bacterium]|nr:hypothetical protein [Thermomicrobiales bacterium]
MAVIPGALTTRCEPTRVTTRPRVAEYDLVDLGSVQRDANESTRLLMPKSIDAAGRVLGNRVNADGSEAPFLASTAGANELPAPDRSTRVTAAIGAGSFVGRTGGYAGVWAAGAWRELPLPELPDERCLASFAGAAEDSGWIAGWMVPEAGGTLPLVWEAGVARILPPVGDLTGAWPV